MKQNAYHPYGQLFEQRELSDRRQQHFKSFLFSLHNGRRIKARREQETEQGFYTDHYEKWVGITVITITLLSLMDALLTLNILERGGIEVNPFMSVLLAIDTSVFLIGKFIITVVCLLFALVHINFHVLRILPMKTMLAAIVIFYLFLIGYEIFLLAFI